MVFWSRAVVIFPQLLDAMGIVVLFAIHEGGEKSFNFKVEPPIVVHRLCRFITWLDVETLPRGGADLSGCRKSLAKLGNLGRLVGSRNEGGSPL